METDGTAALLEHTEVVLPSFAVGSGKDALATLLNEDLAFLSVVFFLTRVVSTLFFLDVRLATRQYQPPQRPS